MWSIIPLKKKDQFPPPICAPTVVGNVTAQSNLIYFCVPLSLLMPRVSWGTMCRCDAYCADTGRNMDLAISVSHCHPELFWILWKKTEVLNLLCNQNGAVFSLRFTAMKFLFAHQPSFQQCWVWGPKIAILQSLLILKSPSTWGDRIHGGGIVIPLVILLSQPGTNNPWMLMNVQTWILDGFALGRKN